VPCPCGENDFDKDVEVMQSHSPRVVQYFGDCPRCGRYREFFFELEDPPEGDPDRFLLGHGEAASTIIDAGQWLLVAEMSGQVLARVAESDEPLVGEQIPAVHEMLLLSAASVDEVLKFLPPGADRVPDDAFWTEQGLAVRGAAGPLLERDELTAAGTRRWASVEEFEAVYEIREDDDDDEDDEAVS
jgi:hypothetical protein